MNTPVSSSAPSEPEHTAALVEDEAIYPEAGLPAHYEEMPEDELMPEDEAALDLADPADESLAQDLAQMAAEAQLEAAVLALDGSDSDALMMSLVELGIERSREQLVMLNTQGVLVPAPEGGDPLTKLGSSVTAIVRRGREFINAERKSSKSLLPALHRLDALTPQQTARLMLEAAVIVRVLRAVSDVEDERQLELGVYVEDEADPKHGLYDVQPSRLYELLARVRPGMNQKQQAETIEHLRTLAPLREVNTDPSLIPAANGVLRYPDLELEEYGPERVFLNRHPVKWVPNAPEPVRTLSDGTTWRPSEWMEQLASNPQGELDQEKLALLWQTISALLQSQKSVDRMVLLYSETGNNGKGTFCALLRELVGPKQAVSIPITSFGDRFALTPLLRASAVIVDENPVGAYLADAKDLKSAITADEITIERKYQDPVTMRFFGLVVQCVNELPKFRDKSESLHRRMMLVPFEQEFSRVDANGKPLERREIKRRFIRESEVLEWVMWHALSQVEPFEVLPETEFSKEALAEYVQATDTVAAFYEDVLSQVTEQPFLSTGLIYRAYKHWMKDNHPGAPCVPQNHFSKQINKLAETDGWVRRANANPLTAVQRKAATAGLDPVLSSLLAVEDSMLSQRHINLMELDLAGRVRGLVRVDHPDAYLFAPGHPGVTVPAAQAVPTPAASAAPLFDFDGGGPAVVPAAHASMGLIPLGELPAFLETTETNVQALSAQLETAEAEFSAWGAAGAQGEPPAVEGFADIHDLRKAAQEAVELLSRVRVSVKEKALEIATSQKLAEADRLERLLEASEAAEAQWDANGREGFIPEIEGFADLRELAFHARAARNGATNAQAKLEHMQQQTKPKQPPMALVDVPNIPGLPNLPTT